MEDRKDYPLVSVIIPVRNASQFLEECFDSIMSQTYPADRLTVSICDDGSTDGSLEMIAEWKRVMETRGIHDVTVCSARPGSLVSPQDGELVDCPLPSESGSYTTDSGIAYCFSPGLPNDSFVTDAILGEPIPKPSDSTSAVATSYEERKQKRRKKWGDDHLSSVTMYSKDSHAHPFPDGAHGPAVARNTAVSQCSGAYLCFLDADDVMEPRRVEDCVQVAGHATSAFHWEHQGCDPTLYGTQFSRMPQGATPRYTAWHNGLSPTQLMNQRFRECTIAQPTWFMSKKWFERLGGYDESDWRAEDLLLLHRHIEHGGSLARIDAPLVRYRWLGQGRVIPPSLSAPTALKGGAAAQPQGSKTPEASLSTRIHRLTLLQVRIEALQQQVLSTPGWAAGFALWGAGRDGKDVFKRMNADTRKHVRCFIDVDPAKIGRVISAVPVVAPTHALACPPVVTCVALDRGGTGNGPSFEEELAKKSWVEGKDYFHLI